MRTAILPLLLAVAAATLAGEPADEAPLRAADVPCDQWTLQGYRLGMSKAEAKGVQPSRGFKPSSSLSTHEKSLYSKFTVGRKKDGWTGTVTIKKDELVKLGIHYTELSFDELVADLISLFGEPIVDGDRRHFKSHRCDRIVVAEEHPKRGARIVLQSISDHVVEKYKKGGSR